MATQVTTPDATAPQSPQTHALNITEAQKQALMENLQLEISDRARKLRAQYQLQAQGLRNRLEMRINRIPHALRRTNMAQLLQKHLDDQNKPNHSSLAKPKTLKRKSDDKENTSVALSNPKKRSKPNNNHPTSIPTSPNLSRSVRKAPQPLNTAILSPKSPNSRTLRTAPLKSPQEAKSPPPLTRPRPGQLPRSKAGTTKRPATAPTSTMFAQVAQQPVLHSDEDTVPAPSTARRDAQPSRPQTAMALSPKKVPAVVTAKPVRTEKPKEKEKAVAQPATTGTVKKGTFKSAMASLTGSKRGKKTAVATTAAAATAAVADSATPPPIGRVLRKRAA